MKVLEDWATMCLCTMSLSSNLGNQVWLTFVTNTCDQHLNKVRQWRTESANIILDSVHIIVTYRPLCFTEMLVTPSPSWAHHDLYDQIGSEIKVWESISVNVNVNDFRKCCEVIGFIPQPAQAPSRQNATCAAAYEYLTLGRSHSDFILYFIGSA